MVSKERNKFSVKVSRLNNRAGIGTFIGVVVFWGWGGRKAEIT